MTTPTLTTNEYCARYDIDVRHANRLARSGRVPAVKDGDGWLFAAVTPPPAVPEVEGKRFWYAVQIKLPPKLEVDALDLAERAGMSLADYLVMRLEEVVKCPK